VLASIIISLPILGIVFLSSITTYGGSIKRGKAIALLISIINLVLSLFIFVLFHHSTNQFQYIKENNYFQYYNLNMGVDGLSIYFLLLTTVIMPIALLSN
jgi:NADH:ubiquinone oxidoreductase subunit 4 (subunit M)